MRNAQVVVFLKCELESYVLLQLRSPSKRFFPGSFCAVGGQAEHGDASSKHVAVREVWEEAGLRLDPSSLHFFARSKRCDWFYVVLRPEALYEMKPATHAHEVGDVQPAIRSGRLPKGSIIATWGHAWVPFYKLHMVKFNMVGVRMRLREAMIARQQEGRRLQKTGNRSWRAQRVQKTGNRSWRALRGC